MWTLQWAATIAVLSQLGILLVVIWDWFFFSRLPYARWKTAQFSPQERNLLRELIRVRRIEAGRPNHRAEVQHPPDSANGLYS